MPVANEKRVGPYEPMWLDRCFVLGQFHRLSPHTAKAVVLTARAAWIMVGLTVLCSLAFIGEYYRYIFTQEFFVSFVSSLWASVLFFSILGITTLLVFSNNPRYDDLYIKLWYIFGGSSRDQKILDMVKKKIEKMAAVAETSELNIVFLDYNETINAAKIEINHKVKICNICHDRPFIDDSEEVVIFTDAVDLPSNADLGGFTNLRITGPGGEEIHDSGSTYPLKGNIHRHSFKYKLKIEGDGWVNYVLRYWYWADLSEKQFFGVNHITKLYKVSFSNQVADPFSVELVDAPSAGRRAFNCPSLKLGDVESCTFEHLDPNERVVFSFGRSQH